MLKIRILFVAWMLPFVVLSACHREAQTSFVASLRCGMTRDEVSQLARKHGYNSSDASWLARSSKQSPELILIDLTFRAERLVAVRQGTYDPRTRQTTWRTRDLCSAR